MPRILSRRQFARLLAGAFTALPLLESLPALGQETPSAGPKRLVLLFNPNGTIGEDFWPAAGATETAFELGRILQPLAEFKDKMLLLRGLAPVRCRPAGPPGWSASARASAGCSPAASCRPGP